MVMSTQRTIGTGITQRTCILKKESILEYTETKNTITHRDRYPDELAVTPYRNCFDDTPFSDADISQR